MNGATALSRCIARKDQKIRVLWQLAQPGTGLAETQMATHHDKPAVEKIQNSAIRCRKSSVLSDQL